MSNIVINYLNKRGIKGPWKLYPTPNKKFHNIIVIPSYAESKHIGLTLDSLSKCELSELHKSLVIVVVNNEEDAKLTIIKDNLYTLNNLKLRDDPFFLCTVDATSKGYSIPQKHAGVGMARKIGMDLGLYFASSSSLLFSLDADTIVSEDYLSEPKFYFDSIDKVALVVGFSHLKNENPILESAIRKYELFLQDTAKKLQNSGSPFGYVSMGSTIICRTKAYASIGGMPKRKATEDFYFLQELAKYKGVGVLKSILVYPSSRKSNRVYLGTGYRMNQINEGEDLTKLIYPDKSFEVLQKWILLAKTGYKKDIKQILKKVKLINNLLYNFLIEENIEKIWNPLRFNSPTEINFQNQFHRWFDALKTYRFLNRFRINT